MKHCLIVDDSDVIRKVARSILEKLKLEVSEAADGQQALERCSARLPDAILLDWHMPTESGIDFLVQLRRIHPKRPYVIYCTTEYNPADIERALAAGADDYLMKPYGREDVRAKLGNAGFI
jgi:two-component system, chemotaxis family, chemotaxis protein CheY